MDAANLRPPDDARKLWCATSNQMCRADECGHWKWSKLIKRELEQSEEDGCPSGEGWEYLSFSIKDGKMICLFALVDYCTIGRCGLIHA